jgi:sugar phosphate permease
MRVTPKSVGLPIVEIYKNEDPKYIKKIQDEKKLN